MSIRGKLELKRLRLLAMKAFNSPQYDEFHKQHSCKRKVRYSKESAVSAAQAMKEKTGDEFDVYECLYCDGWHIGHSSGINWEVDF